VTAKLQASLAFNHQVTALLPASSTQTPLHSITIPLSD